MIGFESLFQSAHETLLIRPGLADGMWFIALSASTTDVRRGERGGAPGWQGG
ncbi:MAG TPA: hypothetical protein VES02_10495 [Dermatophilaceae bacterium]|nr:hypothetical protein [Dermatophilaceae bacterium]